MTYLANRSTFCDKTWYAGTATADGVSFEKSRSLYVLLIKVAVRFELSEWTYVDRVVKRITLRGRGKLFPHSLLTGPRDTRMSAGSKHAMEYPTTQWSYGNG